MREAELRLLHAPISYAAAWDLQTRLHHERVADTRHDTVLILEHLPVYTLGRSTTPSDWGGDPVLLQAEGAHVQHVNRGGSVTYHGPGQVIVYPILRLTDYARGVKQYVRQLEDVIIHCLRAYGIEGQRRDKTPGVWITAPHEAKIASIGIRVEHGVTMHGIALNVQMDLSPFDRITPCGLTNCRITSMAEVLGRMVSVADVKRDLAGRLSSLLGITWLPPSLNTEPSQAQ
ncbi:MAG: lipoyl(octanoyl) transferase LipB [Nitrospira sp.]|nr:lipoyl(octanoyl) transferase LipB [Nitrospira sp.]